MNFPFEIRDLPFQNPARRRTFLGVMTKPRHLKERSESIPFAQVSFYICYCNVAHQLWSGECNGNE